MAMVLTDQKPIQKNRVGEVLEDLPGSTKSVACVERNVRNLGDPDGSCRGRCMGLVHHRQMQVGGTETTSRKAEDHAGVGPAHSTRRRSGRSHGEGAGRNT